MKGYSKFKLNIDPACFLTEPKLTIVPSEPGQNITNLQEIKDILLVIIICLTVLWKINLMPHTYQGIYLTPSVQQHKTYPP
jgi:hypothetical protein